MLAAAQHSYYLQTNSKWVSTEIALIRAAAQRAELLRRKSQTFTCEERQMIRWGNWALQQLLLDHHRLILRLVSTYRAKAYNSGNTDLEQEATLAFLDAVATYDPTRGAKLSTWAYFQIRSRLQKVIGQLIKEAIATAKVMQSESTFSGPEPIQDQELLNQLRSTIHKLTEKQRIVILLHLNGLEWAELALKLRSTADAVRMLWTRAVRRLRLLLLGKSKPEKPKEEVVEPQLEESKPEKPKEEVVEPQPADKPLSLHSSISALIAYDLPDLPQRRGQNLTGDSLIEKLRECGAQIRLLDCRNCVASWCLEFGCCDGIRGSPY